MGLTAARTAAKSRAWGAGMAAAVAAKAARRANEIMVYVEKTVWLEVLNEWKKRLEEDVENIRSDLDMGTLKYFFDWDNIEVKLSPS